MKAEEVNPERELVFFDLETTGLGQSCEIVQLAAVSGSHSINLYTIPSCRMQPGAAKVTGFRVRRRRLFLHRRPVLTNSLKEVFVSFIAFLRMLQRPLLVGHNIRRFDCPLLARALDRLGLSVEFQLAATGYLDTLPLARELFKDHGLRSFRQENLVRELLGAGYNAHDALEDVRALQGLYAVLRPTAEMIGRHLFTLDTVVAKSVSKPAVDKATVPPGLAGQRPLWEHFKQAERVTENTTKDSVGPHDSKPQAH